jgi:RimJ/RimL family protein N-acetyltransferase
MDGGRRAALEHRPRRSALIAVFETERLRLREFRADDLDQLAPMVADEEQMQFYAAPRTRDEARAWIDRNLSFYETHGFGVWLIESRATSEFLGYCGIRPLELAGAEVTEIGWHVKKTAWNRGYATEAAGAARDLAFDRFARTRLVALVPPEHTASRRVAEKIGMREEAEVVFDGGRYATYASER